MATYACVCAGSLGAPRRYSGDRWFRSCVCSPSNIGSTPPVLSSWFDFLLGCKEIDLSVDLIVYLKVSPVFKVLKYLTVCAQTDPEVALQRVRERSRGEEHLISEEYIRDLHNLHEDWLINQKYPVPAPVVGETFK